MPRTLDSALEERAINTIRMLSVDAVQKANSGHPGLPMGAAAMAYVLWTEYLQHNPRNPQWPNRDRFVLSAGHGSALLYSLLHLTGYDLSLDEVMNFRQLGSKTPGHPENFLTPGVDVTTGPLGQGFANGVGMAIAEAYLAARYNRPGHPIIDHFTYGLVSDGDVMEGVAMEAASIAGHLRLGKLIYFYDANDITLAGTANLSLTEDTAARFAAQGWHVQSIDGMDTDTVRGALEGARSEIDRPSIIIARTVIGFGSPKKAGTFGVHGSPLGPDEVTATKQHLGWPVEPAFYLPDDALEFFRSAVERGAGAEANWNSAFEAYASAHPALAAELKRSLAGELPQGWDSDVPTWSPGDKAISTRKASEAVIQAFFPHIPGFIGGSADLNPSTNTGMKSGGDFGPRPDSDDEDIQGSLGGGWGYDGRNIHWGIREHAMGSAVNGMAAHGGVVPFSATFLVFADYMRPPIRLAALSHYRSIFVFTHDSIAVGEDGPTHEPVEQIMSLRLIPGLTVIRPADANETAEAWRVALEHRDGPVVLVFSRQDLAVLDRSGARGSLDEGAYILHEPDRRPDVVLIATGSEVDLAIKAAGLLAEHDIAARVVSMPSWELFEQQPEHYRESVLGPDGTHRLSVEAGVTTGWQRYTGSYGGSVGIDRFGASGPGSQVLEHFGFTKERVASAALHLLNRDAEAHEIEAKSGNGETAGKEAKGHQGHS
ncbi:MAG: transketolase [Thermomicrobiales bacterium]